MLPAIIKSSILKIDSHRIVFVFSKAGAGVCATLFSLDNQNSSIKEVGRSYLSNHQAKQLISKLESSNISYYFDESIPETGSTSATFTSKSVFLIDGQSEKIDVINDFQEVYYVSPFVESDFIFSTQQTRGPNC